jgi:hypothetical protein
MKRQTLRTLLLSALFCLSLAAQHAAGAQDRPRRSLRLPDVRKIYVGDMGKSDEAERFRFLVGQELAKKGFTVVDAAEESDAVLTGALSVRVGDDNTEARAFVRLESRDGQRLWARDFGNRLIYNPFKRREPAKRRAAEIAAGLRDDWEKAGK